jgi:hypothetical protein
MDDFGFWNYKTLIEKNVFFKRFNIGVVCTKYIIVETGHARLYDLLITQPVVLAVLLPHLLFHCHE